MTNRLKYTIAFLTIFLIRLIPFRAPNVEPLMAVVMPMSKKLNSLNIFIFSFLSIFVFDLVTSGLGIWTLIAGLSYGLVGLGANYFFKNRSGWKNYALYAFGATIFYDALTGLTIGPLFFNQSLTVSFIGQIPFTILHLLGNASFAIVISPIIEKWFKRKDITVRNFWTKEVKLVS